MKLLDKPTVHDIFLRFYPGYLEKYSPSPVQSKVANCIINCKTGAYGANISICEDCGHIQIHYNSCLKGSTVDYAPWDGSSLYPNRETILDLENVG